MVVDEELVEWLGDIRGGNPAQRSCAEMGTGEDLREFLRENG
jgi:hypothetical protein